MKLQNRSSFTILELIIVLFVMGLMYSLSITNFSNNTIKNNKIYFNLKNILISHVKRTSETIELIVFEDNSYSILVDNQEFKNKKFDLPKDIEFFSYNQDDSLKEDFKPYYKDEYFENVIFRFKIYTNKSSTRAIVFTDEKYYIQSAYISDRMVFKTIEEAKEYLLLELMKQRMVPVNV